MALIRGKNGLCPCPICLAPGQKLMNLLQSHLRRTSDQSESVFQRAKGFKTLADKEKLFKEFSLRPVKVCALLDFEVVFF